MRYGHNVIMRVFLLFLALYYILNAIVVDCSAVVSRLEKELYDSIFKEQFHGGLFVEELKPVKNPVSILNGNAGTFVSGFMSNQVLFRPNVIDDNQRKIESKWTIFANGVYCNRAQNTYDTCAILDGPWGLAESEQKIFIGSFGSDQILVFELSTRSFLGAFGDASTLDCPEGMVFGPDGLLYVANFGQNSVVKFNATTGEFLGVAASGPWLEGPEDLCFESDGNLLVSSHFSNSIARFMPNGTFVGVAARPNAPLGIECLSTNSFMVSSYTQNEVVQFCSLSGKVLRVAASGNGIRGPSGIDFRRDAIQGDILHVASYENHRVLGFNVTEGSVWDAMRGVLR